MQKSKSEFDGDILQEEDCSTHDTKSMSQDRKGVIMSASGIVAMTMFETIQALSEMVADLAWQDGG